MTKLNAPQSLEFQQLTSLQPSEWWFESLKVDSRCSVALWCSIQPSCSNPPAFSHWGCDANHGDEDPNAVATFLSLAIGFTTLPRRHASISALGLLRQELKGAAQRMSMSRLIQAWTLTGNLKCINTSLQSPYNLLTPSTLFTECLAQLSPSPSQHRTSSVPIMVRVTALAGLLAHGRPLFSQYSPRRILQAREPRFRSRPLGIPRWGLDVPA